jgi:isopenicillin-N epimerase
LDEQIVPLNHASFGATPEPVRVAWEDVRRWIDRNADEYFWYHHIRSFDEVRDKLARFIGSEFDSTVMVPNVTFAVNSVVRALSFEPGDEIITTNHTYGACRFVLDYVARERGLKVVEIKVPFEGVTDEEFIGLLEAACTARTRLCFVDHITSLTTLVFPIERISRLCQSRNIPLCIDGAHAPGQTELDLSKIRSAFYTGNLHKWACSPRGTAFLCVPREYHSQIVPASLSWGVPTSETSLGERFSTFGTLDYSALLAIPASLEFVATVVDGGVDGFRKLNRTLLRRGTGIIGELLQIAVNPHPELFFCSFRLPKVVSNEEILECVRKASTEPGDAEALTRVPQHLHLSWLLRKVADIDTVFQIFEGRLVVRTSAFCYNTDDDFVRLGEALIRIGLGV